MQCCVLANICSVCFTSYLKCLYFPIFRFLLRPSTDSGMRTRCRPFTHTDVSISCKRGVLTKLTIPQSLNFNKNRNSRTLVRIRLFVLLALFYMSADLNSPSNQYEIGVFHISIAVKKRQCKYTSLRRYF